MIDAIQRGNGLTEEEANAKICDALMVYIAEPLDALEYVKRVIKSPGRGHKDKQKRTAICKAFRAGYDIKVIASRLGCTYSNVWRILKDEGLLLARKIDRIRQRRKEENEQA